MLDQQMIYTIALLVSMFSLVLAVLFYLQKIKMKQKYDHVENRALIENMRNSFEKSIYSMTERLVSVQERWMDVNHLVISSQKNQIIDLNKKGEVYITEFLKLNGVTEKDIEVDKRLVFVLTPFNREFINTFELIQYVCNKVDLKCLRGDEQYIKSDIFPHILKLIVKANIVIANLDGRNTNVFYELGIAHAMNKNTILIAKATRDLPIDLKSKYLILYKDYNDLDIQLRNNLIRILSSERNQTSL